MYPQKRQGFQLGENVIIKVVDKDPAKAISEDRGEGTRPRRGGEQ